MTLIPTVVTFLTLMVMRGGLGEDSSAFILSLVQIPADFVTGMFCALIIFIIVNAPRKKDKDKPVMFTLNLTEKKGLFINAAIAHVIFGYFAGGVLGLMMMVYEPMQQAVDNGAQPSVAAMLLVGLFLFVFFYGVRFILLPVLIVAGYDVVAFFKRYALVGFSLPVFLLKAATTMAVGFFVMIITVPLMSAGGGMENISTVQLGLIDFVTSFGNVVATAWMYAALAVGWRELVEGKQEQE